MVDSDDACGKSASEESNVTRTRENPFEASTGQKTQYYVGVVKDKRTGSSSLGGVAIQTLNMIRGACN
jgi:hypothetical protein